MVSREVRGSIITVQGRFRSLLWCFDGFSCLVQLLLQLLHLFPVGCAKKEVSLRC